MQITCRELIAVLAVFLAARGVAGQAAVARSYPPVPIAGSELRTLHSSNTGRDYDIYVLLPQTYAGNPGRKYPVLYVLDGQWDFKLLASITGGLYYDRYVPDMFVVGITYSGRNANYDTLRAMDYTPAATSQLRGSGDAPKFLQFIRRELTPFIESNYRADPAHRVLLGNSFGGLFTVYAMLSDPAFFSGYIASSPAVTYADRAAFAQETAYAAKTKELNARLFVGVGADEPLSGPVQEYVRALKSRGYSGLRLESRVIEAERHSGNKPESYNRGLRFIFTGN